MVHWLSDTKLMVESFVLKETQIRNLDDFAKNHGFYLVSIEDSPAEAAHWWHWQQDRKALGEGWISMRLNGVEIMPKNAWTNIDLFWDMVLSVIDNYLDKGEGVGTFSEERAQFSISKKNSIALVNVRGDKYPVAPFPFLNSLLDGAREFYTWGNKYIGTYDNSYLDKIKRLVTKLSTL